MRAPSRLFGSLFFTLSVGAAIAGAAQDDGYDLIVRNGRVVDGTGNPARFADVGVRDGRITAIGRLSGAAKTEVDARGLVVAPGFIDVHTHAEDVASRREAQNFVRMGVTSIVTGNCGRSWGNIAESLRRLEEPGASVNVATLVGHNTVRSSAMGGSFDREPTAEELDRMRALVEEGMKDGAVGLSTGLIYLPGTFSRTDEIVELAKVASRYGGIYASHMRNEGSDIDSALGELFRIAREARIRADVSHIKLSGKPAWGRAPQILEKIEQARAEGLDITADQYAYTASSTGISTLIPASAREGGDRKFQERIADPEQKRKIVESMKRTLAAGQRTSYDYAYITSYSRDRSLNGKNIPEAARIKRGSDSLDDQIELILEIEQSGGAGGVFHGMNEEDLKLFLAYPNTMVASDSGVREGGGDSVPHPRGYGNNVRVLGRYVREQKVLRLEDAIRKMTSLPATTFRLKDRGLVREGGWADLVVFDPATVGDKATFERPHQYPEGIRYVIVNGVPVLRDGEHTKATPGKALRMQGQ